MSNLLPSHRALASTMQPFFGIYTKRMADRKPLTFEEIQVAFPKFRKGGWHECFMSHGLVLLSPPMHCASRACTCEDKKRNQEQKKP